MESSPTNRPTPPATEEQLPAAAHGEAGSTTQPERQRDKPATRRTRTSGAWTGLLLGALVLLLLLIFILENTQSVKVSFFGADGHVSLGVALLLSAVAGALIVGVTGAARITQLRARAKRAERRTT